MTTDDVANKVVSQMKKPENGYDSIITIIMIAGIIITLIRVMQECDSDKMRLLKRIHTLSRRKTWLSKWRLKNIIKKQIPKEIYSSYGVSICDSIMQVGEELTDEELTVLLETK